MPITKNNIARDLSGIPKKLKTTIPQKAWKFFKDITPIDTGFARRRTKLRRTTIVADYHYASYLDNGHSKQAPQGMSEPTTRYLNNIVRKILRRRSRG
jgi:ABC-type Zn uptake system ZnuABC Zn-binding protein ZnuA